MIGLDMILASHLILAEYKVKCEMKEAPQINVIARGVDRIIDNSMPISELTKFKPMLNSKGPYGDNVETHIQGLTHGRIGVEGGYEFATQTWPDLEKVCMYASKVDVKITLDPKIYIAREYAPGSCEYNAVLGHEMKHFKTDRDLVNKYTNIIVKAVNNTLIKVGYSHGPYDVSQLPALQKQIGGIIESVIQQFSQNMNKERRVLQAQVDSLAEYQRVDALCPGGWKTRPSR